MNNNLLSQNEISYEYYLETFKDGLIRIVQAFALPIHTMFKYKGLNFWVHSFVDQQTILCHEIFVNPFDRGAYQSHQPAKIDYEEKILSYFNKRGVELTSSMLSEETFRKVVLEALQPYFEIEEECWGKHFSGRSMKIDAILKPKDVTGWRNKDIVFGLEIKNPLTEKMNNRRDTDILAQCLDYALSVFKGYENMIVLLCPNIQTLQEKNKLWGFVSRYNVGSVEFGEQIEFMFSSQPLWRESGPADLLKKSMFEKKFGNRGYRITKEAK